MAKGPLTVCGEAGNKDGLLVRKAGSVVLLGG